MIVIPLKIVAPINITTQPVTLGVPFPRGVLRDPATLGIFDEAGKPVLLQTTTLAKWVDGSVRWLLVDFILDRLTMGIHRWEIRDGGGSPPSLGLNFMQTPDEIHLDTTVCRFTLTRQGAALPDKIDGEGFSLGNETSDPPLGMLIGLKDVKTRGNLSDLGRGPVRATLNTEGGRVVREGGKLYVRSSFFAGTSLLRLNVTLRNPRPARHKGGMWDLGDRNSLSPFIWSLYCCLPGDTQRVTWKTEPNQDERTTEARTFQLRQLSSGGANWQSRVHVGADGHVTLPYQGYKVDVEGESLSGNRASPLVTAHGRDVAVTVAFPDFWQQFPKSIEVIDWAGRNNDSVNRLLSVELVPCGEGERFELQGGEQKSCTLWMQFGKSSEARPSLGWVYQPALVQVAPEWVERCGVLPFFPTSIAPGVAGEPFAMLMRDALEGPDSFFAKRERIDEYGWRHFGELYADHENEHYPGTKPIVSHYNNQYDALNGMLMLYLHTGDPRWWQLADPLARHLYDIDIYHTDQDRPAYNGGMFWHTDHYKDAATATHRAYSKANKPLGKPYGGGPGNEHNWSTGLLNYYYLTGDPLAREAVLSLANWVIDRDDGSMTFIGLIDDGPTGLSSRTGGDGSYHGPGRGGGNSINSLLDGWLLTDERRYLDKAEQLIRRCIHPTDDLDALDMGNPEERWSYTVFLSVLVRYLELKRQADQVDERFAYARASLLHYGRWMAAHEKPYFDQVERLEFPNETWAAQEMRKANVIRLAARYAEEPERSAMLKRGDELADRAWHDIYRFETRTSTRSLAILMTEGLRDSYLRTHSEERVTETGPIMEFGSPMNFVPQRTRVKRQLKSVRGVLQAIPRLLNPWRWWRACRTRQFW